MTTLIIIFIALAVLLFITVKVSRLFMKNILEAVPDRNTTQTEASADTTASSDDACGDPVKAAYLENNRRLKVQGREFEETTSEAEITNADGLRLRARYRLQDGETHNWIISIHGYKESHRYMLPYGVAFYQKGYHVLMPDNRAHGSSEGDYIGMGWLDKEDISEWVAWIVAQDAQAKIILHGVSMGGATVMMTSGKNLDHVAGYIEDCGYTSVWDIFACVIKRDYHLPTFPIMHVCHLISKRKAGYGFFEASAIRQLSKCDKPVLFIHGEKDDFVPLEMGHRVYEAFSGKKALYIAANAGHANSMDYDPDTYFARVFGFIESNILAD